MYELNPSVTATILLATLVLFGLSAALPLQATEDVVAEVAPASPETSPASTGAATPIIPPDQAPEPGMQIALLENPVPRVDSVAELVELAHEYGWNWDPDTKKALLREAARRHPGSSDAVIALLELARTHSEEGELEQAEAVFAEAAAYEDAECQAFVSVMRKLCDFLRVKDYPAAEALLNHTTEDWSGAELGAWAALQLGSLLRDYTHEFNRALPYYRAAMQAYPNTLVAEEADLSIAECLSWPMVRPAESAELYEAVLDRLTSPRLRARAITGYGITLCQVGEDQQAFDLLTDFVQYYPYDPCVPLARAYRALAAVRLDDWDSAVADAKAFIEAPIGQHGHPWLHNSEHTLGEYAFRQHHYEEAIGHFQRAIDAAPDPEAKAKSAAGAARAEVELGDLDAAVQLFLDAAEYTQISALRCIYLREAARIANEAGDTVASQEIQSMIEADCAQPPAL
jgi:tetratricopeptide (TPR) repeat protein